MDTSDTIYLLVRRIDEVVKTAVHLGRCSLVSLF